MIAQTDRSLWQLRRTALLRGLRRACPQCGATYITGEDGAGGDGAREHAVFRSYARLRESCRSCGLVLRREQGAQTGSMYMTAVVCQTFACLVVWAAWLWTDWSAPVFISIAVPVVALFCVLFLPFSQTLWAAVEYATDAVNDEDWVEPR